MYWVLLCLSSGTDLKKSRYVLKSLSLCNKVLSYLILSLSLFFFFFFYRHDRRNTIWHKRLKYRKSLPPKQSTATLQGLCTAGRHRCSKLHGYIQFTLRYECWQTSPEATIACLRLFISIATCQVKYTHDHGMRHGGVDSIHNHTHIHNNRDRWTVYTNMKQNESQSVCAESAHKGVN